MHKSTKVHIMHVSKRLTTPTYGYVDFAAFFFEFSVQSLQYHKYMNHIVYVSLKVTRSRSGERERESLLWGAPSSGGCVEKPRPSLCFHCRRKPTEKE